MTRPASATDARVGDDGYTVRWYRSGDAPAVCSLFAAALDRDWDPEVLRWKYEQSPFLDHAPVNLAERDGRIVGVQAYVPFPLRDATGTFLALQPADAVVHPDHRRNGLYTRLTTQAIDRYEGGEPSLFFNYPTEGALGAQESLGWSQVADVPVAYRIHRPSAFVDGVVDGPAGASLERIVDAVARGGYRAVDALAPSRGDLSVTRHTTPPGGVLASLYERAVPARIHLHRDATLYDWWFANPATSYTAYVAHADWPVAALVTRSHESGALQVREVVPLAPFQPTAAVARLLLTALADHPGATVVKTAGETLGARVERRLGFLGDDAPVLDRRTEPHRMAVRPLTGEDQGRPASTLTDADRWHRTFLEIDRD